MSTGKKYKEARNTGKLMELLRVNLMRDFVKRTGRDGENATKVFNELNGIWVRRCTEAQQADFVKKQFTNDLIELLGRHHSTVRRMRMEKTLKVIIIGLMLIGASACIGAIGYIIHLKLA
jgi:hypothetical protein